MTTNNDECIYCKPDPNKKPGDYGPKSRIGLWIGGSFGLAGLVTMAVATPFVLPALRKHCLPYVPATDTQLENLRRAFMTHSRRGDRFLDVGSGDGRVCREAAKLNLYTEVHGVELNYILVLYSRLKSLQNLSKIRYFHKDLWKFPLSRYESICIFGVDTMMSSLEKYLQDSNEREQTVYACRFPFTSLTQIDEVGDGIDTVWVYKVKKT